jgi:hypothetical protein
VIEDLVARDVSVRVRGRRPEAEARAAEASLPPMRTWGPLAIEAPGPPPHTDPEGLYHVVLQDVVGTVNEVWVEGGRDPFGLQSLCGLRGLLPNGEDLCAHECALTAEREAAQVRLGPLNHTCPRYVTDRDRLERNAGERPAVQQFQGGVAGVGLVDDAGDVVAVLFGPDADAVPDHVGDVLAVLVVRPIISPTAASAYTTAATVTGSTIVVTIITRIRIAVVIRQRIPADVVSEINVEDKRDERRTPPA